jgi:hypothetical protein
LSSTTISAAGRPSSSVPRATFTVMRAPSGRAGGILQCIVEQVRDDFAQQHRIAAHVQCFVVAGLVAALEAEIDVRRERARHPLGAGLERHRGEVDVDETRNLFARLRASERQQLVGQPHRAIGSRARSRTAV